MQVAALVLAAGGGARLGAEVPKAFVLVAGKTLLTRSIETLARVPVVDRVVPVIPASELQGWRAPAVGPKLAHPVLGGARRQDSVAAGLKSLPDRVGWVVVHDAARCLVSDEEVEAVIHAAMTGGSGAAILACPSPDTVKLVRDGVIESTPDRRACWVAQTPQVFRVDVLREAIEKAEAEGFEATDDAQLVERMGVVVRIVEGSPRNLKITHPADIAIAEALIASAASDERAGSDAKSQGDHR
jgi:2-C-methyl-D-erythritol 4-phosphate cytidylyltransferase